MYLIRVVSFDLVFSMSGVCICWVVVGRERGDWWLPAGGIRAPQGTFSSFFQDFQNFFYSDVCGQLEFYAHLS